MGVTEVVVRSKQSGIRLLWAVACALLVAPPLYAQPSRDGTIARLVQLNGNVLVSRESGLTSGNDSQRIAPGTRVITTANSEVVVEYDDGCRVRLKENQRFEVERGKPCALLLAQDLLVAPAAVSSSVAATVAPAVFIGGGIAMLIDGRGRPPVSPN